MGIVPLGTANVLAHELGLPLDPPGTADILALGPARPIRLGMANGRCFAKMAGAGPDARMVERVSRRLERLIGKGGLRNRHAGPPLPAARAGHARPGAEGAREGVT